MLVLRFGQVTQSRYEDLSCGYELQRGRCPGTEDRRGSDYFGLDPCQEEDYLEVVLVGLVHLSKISVTCLGLIADYLTTLPSANKTST
jgi:hypothetical protein